MSDHQIFDEQREAESANASGGSGGDEFDTSPVGIGLLLFTLGIGVGFPLAIVGSEFLSVNADVVVTIVLTALFILCVIGTVFLIFRQRILRYLFNVSSAQLEQFAGPLAETARHIVDRKADAAASSAEKLTKLAFARWAWISTRRWLIGSLTGLLAAMAALAGTALLFRQNELLATQTVRLEQQNDLIKTQIGLGEAQRTAGLLPALLDIGAGLAGETEALLKDGRQSPIFQLSEISQGLRARMVATTLAVRPYRYLQGAAVDPRDTEGLIRHALSRRPEILKNPEITRRDLSRDPASTLIDRPTSPERGVIIALLHGAGIHQTELLSFVGADFSFADIRVPTLNLISFKFARLRFADFSRVYINSISFGAAELDHARFRHAVIKKCSFSGIPGDQVEPPYASDPSISNFRSNLAGVDFSNATILETGFSSINGLAMNFDNAILSQVNFDGAAISGSTFRNTVLVATSFKGTDVKSIDLDGAYVFEEDFLNRIAKETAKGTFVKGRFAAEAVDLSELGNHPMANQLFAIPETLISDKQLYRIKRVDEFK